MFNQVGSCCIRSHIVDLKIWEKVSDSKNEEPIAVTP